MIYGGDYASGYIYGTLNNNKVLIQTVDNALFIRCILQIDFAGKSWSHVFEVPFFENTAEFYFENYVHSFITQHFSKPTVNFSAVEIKSFEIATINLSIEERDESAILDQSSHTYYMSPGVLEVLFLDLDYADKFLLSNPQTKFISDQGMICCSIVSKFLPTKLEISDGSTTIDVPLPGSSSTKYVHSVIIPMQSIIQAYFNHYTLKLYFPSGSPLELGTYYIVDNLVDHHQILYQNQSGMISIDEFSGQFQNEEEFKTQVQEFTENYTSDIRESDISESFPIQLNTGYIWDLEKHKMLKELISSFNKYLLDESELLRIVNDGSQGLTPYLTDLYLKEETLKFKMANNGNSQNRLF